MKHYFTGILVLVGAFVALTNLQAQDLSGYWQGVEYSPADILGTDVYYPTSATIVQRGNTFEGTYFEYADLNQQIYGLLKVTNGVVRTNTGSFDIVTVIRSNTPPGAHVCTGTVQFTYYPDEEKITARPLYRDCPSTSQLELYRIRLKSDSSFCQGSTTNLLVTGKGVRWYADPTKKYLLQQGNTYQPKLDSTTTFYVTQTIHAAESPVVPFTFHVNKPQIDHIRSVPATCADKMGSLSVEAHSSDQSPLRYKLNQDAFQSSSDFIAKPAGHYQLTVEDEQGCQVSRTVELEDECPSSIHLPTAFSPNQDGLNEGLAIFFPFSTLMLCEVTVFDRWGSIIYHSTVERPLKNGDSVWSGKSNDLSLHSGLYSCSLVIKTPSGTAYQLINRIQLIN